MGLELSTARYLGAGSFVYNFIAQQYGLNSKPNMQDIHDRNLSFFSPQPYFIGGFFACQTVVQLAWLWKLWRLNKNNPAEKKELDTIVKFVPYYALGNFCIGTWMFFWNAEHLKIADIFVVVNTTAQLFYVFTQQEPMDTRSWGSILTHVNSKTFAGIGILDIVHNTSVAFYKNQRASDFVKIATAVGFAGLSASSDWIFGGCLVYDLIALSVGQKDYGDQGWSRLLGIYAIGSAAIVAARNLLKPPYVQKGYIAAEQDDVDDQV